MREPTGTSSRCRRGGFTLVELLVAIVLIDVALLALVAASAVVVRRTSDLRAHRHAVHLASNRLETLGAAPCAATAGSANAGADVVERWSVELQPNATRELVDSVTYLTHGNAHALAVRTRLPC